MMRASTARKRVETGAAFLDERLPGWRAVVDSSLLDLGNSCDCVLGQLFSDFETGRDALALTLAKADQLGFYISMASVELDGDIVYRPLTRAWIEELARR